MNTKSELNHPIAVRRVRCRCFIVPVLRYSDHRSQGLLTFAENKRQVQTDHIAVQHVRYR
jgi:hypothetical protein